MSVDAPDSGGGARVAPPPVLMEIGAMHLVQRIQALCPGDQHRAYMVLNTLSWSLEQLSTLLGISLSEIAHGHPLPPTVGLPDPM